MKNPNDPRIGDIIKQPGERADVGIIGIPFDFGVSLSGGRPGAKEAPRAIRRQLKKYGTAYNAAHDADLSKLIVADFGNIKPVKKNVEETHREVTRALHGLFFKKICGAVIVLGGGNDLTFATVKSLKQVLGYGDSVGGMNVDAHLDMRPVLDGRISSGTPYRRLIEGGVMRGSNLFAVGLQGQVNSKAHWEWAQKNNVHLYHLSSVREYYGVKNIIKIFRHCTEKLGALFVSIDIDSVAQAFAPGSSAPNPDGLFPQDILSLAYEAGKIPKVKLFEIMEVNPKFDKDNRTSRLAANIILEFLAGYANRK